MLDFIANPPRAPAPDFRGGIEPRPTDIFIAVMGVTGAGKSTLISLCTDKRVEIGHDLQACTQEVSVYACQYNPNTTVYLVDTPGFDDTNRSDTDVLREIATWLTQSYSNNIKLSGIIYLHRITDRRMQGSAKKNLFMFKKLCGADALKNVILATTMWELVPPEDGERRENELVNTQEFWGWMRDQGSQVIRHMNERDSAMRLIDIFASKQSEKRKVVLDLQEEMVDHGKGLNETTAGMELESELAKERERFRKQLAQAQEEMKEALEARDKESADILRQHQLDMDENVKRLDRERAELKINMERLHEEKYAKLEKSLQATREEHRKTQKALHDAKLEQDRQRQHAEEESRQRQERDRQYKRDMAALEERLKREAKEREEKAIEEARKREKEATEKLKQLSLEVKPRVRSHPGQNRVSECVSITMYKEMYYYCGAAHDFFRVPSDFPKVAGQSNMYVAFGEQGTWFRHYHVQGKCWTQTSGNFKEVYPGLHDYLVDKKQYGCPTCISLGPNGLFFARTEWGYWHRLTDNIIKHVGDMSKVKRLWLGKNNAYVAVRKNGSTAWNLMGHYSGLDDLIKVQSDTLKALAMDPEDHTTYAAVWESGTTFFKPNESYDIFQWQEYCTTNFGTKYT